MEGEQPAADPVEVPAAEIAEVSAPEASAPEASAPEASAQSPRTMRFRKKFTTDRLPADKVERQGKIARIAFEKLGRDGATAFLNTHDDALGGRPLDLAMASVAGFDAMVVAISARLEG